MKKFFLLMFSLLISSLGVAAPTRSEQIISTNFINYDGIQPSNAIRIATYNIRRAGKEQSVANMWESRKPLVFDMINTINPDVIGFQEVVKNQFNDLKVVLADYDSFGEPRSAKMTGLWQKFVMKMATDEYNPLFYKKDQFSLLAQGNFGINPTGRGRLFTANLPRICTWGYFQDKNTAVQFYVYNTHLDNKSGIIRRRQINQIMKHVIKNTQGKPVIFMGDLNTPLKGKKKLRRISRAGFIHAKSIAQQIIGPEETRTGWANSELKKIDHILVKAPHSMVLKYEVVPSADNIFPSDHRPVLVDMIIKE